MGKQYPYSTIWEQNIVVVIHIFGARAIFYYFVITKALNLSHKEYKLMWLDQYPRKKKPKCSARQ